MSILHTVNKSPFERANLASCFNHMVAGDKLLLIEDAVYAAMKGTHLAPRLGDIAKAHKVAVLGPDLLARGLDPANVIGGIDVVDYGTFVDLAAESKSVNAWL